MKRTRTLLICGALAAALIPLSPALHSASAADVATFHGQSPARLLDSRTGKPTIDGLFSGTGAVNGGTTFDLPVLGRGGVPASGVGSVALNVTVTNTVSTGYLTVFPTGSARPNASNLNYTAKQTVPNMVIVAVGASGKVSFFNSTSAGADLVVDVLGWFPSAGAFDGVVPARLLETRSGYSTVDGQFQGGGTVGPNAQINFKVAGRGGVPATGAVAVALNVTVTDTTTAGYLTVFPTGKERPLASNLNYAPGETVPNMVIVPLGDGGQVSIYNSGSANIVVDVLGSFPASSAFSGANPARLLDTRIGQPSVDGKLAGNGALEFGQTFNVVVAGRGGVPATGVGAVALNVTATNPTGNGYLTVYPAGTNRPEASNLNFTTGNTRPNMVLVPLGRTGQISIFNSAGNTDVIVDVLGWFPYPTNPPALLGNDLTLGAHGFGSLSFGTATPAQAIQTVSAVFGTPASDDTIEFTDHESNGLWANDEGEFAYPHGREICWGIALCLDFGDNVASANMPLRGYSYSHDFSTPTKDVTGLFDVHGLSIGARGSDFPGALTVKPGGCEDFGSGTTADGIDVGLRSSGTPFASPAGGTGPLVEHTPRLDEVKVFGFFAGQIIYAFGGC